MADIGCIQRIRYARRKPTVDKEEAVAEVRHLGVSNFYDWVDQQSVEEIFGMIRDNILGTGLPGMKYWERSLEALETILNEYDADEMDSIILEDFNLGPSDVDSGVDFLNQLRAVMTRAIEERRGREAATNQ
jgi:hypothetical protein